MSASFGSGTAVTMKTGNGHKSAKKKKVREKVQDLNRNQSFANWKVGEEVALNLADPRKLKPRPVLREAKREAVFT